jgi:ribonuclease T
VKFYFLNFRFNLRINCCNVFYWKEIIAAMEEEIYISVDIETAGPIPGRNALLSIGACLVEDPSISFYIELKPDKEETSADALAIHALSLENLEITGTEPAEAMKHFEKWIKMVSAKDKRPVFVALNAPFDWMFVNDYFHRYLGYNPFGHSALDIKAYFMGQTGVSWEQTSFKHMSQHFLVEHHHTHNALSDAQDQAEIFRKILKQAAKLNIKNNN